MNYTWASNMAYSSGRPELLPDPPWSLLDLANNRAPTTTTFAIATRSISSLTFRFRTDWGKPRKHSGQLADRRDPNAANGQPAQHFPRQQRPCAASRHRGFQPLSCCQRRLSHQLAEWHVPVPGRGRVQSSRQAPCKPAIAAPRLAFAQRDLWARIFRVGRNHQQEGVSQRESPTGSKG